MEWDAVYRAFFTLLRAGLWNREPDDGCFPLTPEAWNRVYRLARKQTLEGVVYDGIMRLPDRCFPPRELLLKWAVGAHLIEERNLRMTEITGEIHALFARNRIMAFLMKGQGVAALYDNPSHRVCGDIDWFFPDKTHFDGANRLMEKKGIRIERQAGFSACYVWNGVVVEHHSRLLDISDPFLSGYLHHMQQRESVQSVAFDAAGEKVLLPSPLMTHLSVNTHILKHLLSFGISIRQLCDSAYVCRAYRSPEEMEALRVIYGKLKIYEWIQLLDRLLVDYLGMPEEYLPFPLASQSSVKADGIMKDILRGGNFGLYGGYFLKESDEPRWERKHTLLQLLARFFSYVRYAPREACWFPVTHTYSRFWNMMQGKR